MTTDSERPSALTLDTLEPVAASTVVKIVLRPLTKVLNPLIGKLAGRRHFHMAAQIRHVGRRSGLPYKTSVGARRSGDMVVIPLTFGNRSDWSQNVRAAGGCSIRLEGQDYIATQPEFLSQQEAKALVWSAFGPVERASLRMLGIKQFLRLHIVPADA